MRSWSSLLLIACASLCCAADGVDVVNITAANPQAKEAGGVPGRFIVTRSPALVARTVTFALDAVALTDGTLAASRGVDYELSGVTANAIQFQPGETSKEILAVPVDQPEAEGAEHVTVILQSGSGYELGSEASAAVTIADDDMTATIRSTSPNAREAGRIDGAMRLAFSGATQRGKAVTVVVSGTAIPGSSSDFTVSYSIDGAPVVTPSITHGLITLTVAATAALVDFTIVPNDDGSPEGRENVVLTLRESADYAVGNPQAATVTIADDDVQLSLIKIQDASEPATPGIFRVTASPAFSRAVTLGYHFDATVSTAIPTADFQPLSGTVTLPAGQASSDIPVIPVADGIGGESTKTIVITLLAGLDGTIAGSPTQTMNLADGIGTVAVAKVIDAQEAAVPIPGRFRVSVVRDPNASGGFSVPYVVTGTATPASDYATASGTATFGQGIDEAFIDVVPVDDNAIEGDETITVTLQAGIGYAIASTSGAATLAIRDDEPVISLVRTADAIEGVSAGSFTVSYPGVPEGTPLGRDIVVKLTAATGTATAATDYTAIPLTVTIPGTARSAAIPVASITDTSAEVEETVVLTLATDAAYLIDSTKATATVRILDVIPATAFQVMSEPADLDVQPGSAWTYDIRLIKPATVDGTRIVPTVITAPGSSALPAWITVDATPRTGSGSALTIHRVTASPPDGNAAQQLRFRIDLAIDITGDGTPELHQVQDITLSVGTLASGG